RGGSTMVFWSSGLFTVRLSFGSKTKSGSHSGGPLQVSRTIELPPSARSVGEGSLHCRACGRRSHNDHRGARVARALGGHIRCNARKAQDMDVQLGSGVTRRLEIFAAVVAQTEVQALSRGRLSDHVGMAVDLIPDRCPNEIGAIGVKSLPNH